MRFIKLQYRDFELFDISWTEVNLNYYSSHKEAYRQMWKEQGKEFWLRYLLTYRSFSSHYGFIGRTAPTFPTFSEMVDWIFIKLHETYVDGTFADVKLFIEDIALFTQHRHLIGIKFRSHAKDPFYMQPTRDAYRRMFGSPHDPKCYSRVVWFPVYEHFVISTFTCLRRWIDAPEATSDDMSYWIQPPPAPEFVPVEPKRKKKGEKKPRFRTTTVPPSADFTMIDIRPLYEAEKNKGKPSGPVFVNGWPSDRDPRFCEPINPLYDPLACRDTDWRCRLDIVSYLRFSDHVAHDKGMLYRYVIESAEDEDIFNDKVMRQIRGMKVKPDPAANTASNDDGIQTEENRNNSSHSRQSGIPSQPETDQPKLADKTMLKKRDEKADASTTQRSADRRHGKSAVDVGKDSGSSTVTEKNAAACPSSDKKSANELLHSCARCLKQESVTHEFKKCKKCKELSVKDAKYYCGRDCQTLDWSDRHRQEHRDWQLALTAAPPSDQ